MLPILEIRSPREVLSDDRLTDVHGVLRTFSSFEEAEDADRAFYASLTPRERLEILLDLVQRQRESMREAPEGFERVYRIAELSER